MLPLQPGSLQGLRNQVECKTSCLQFSRVFHLVLAAAAAKIAAMLRGATGRVGGEREAVKSRRIAIDRCQGTEIENPALAVVASEGSPMMGSAGLGRLLSVAVGVTADRLSGLDVRKIAMVSERRQMSTTLKGLCACKRC
jgi:hypothetical protein